MQNQQVLSIWEKSGRMCVPERYLFQLVSLNFADKSLIVEARYFPRQSRPCSQEYHISKQSPLISECVKISQISVSAEAAVSRTWTRDTRVARVYVTAGPCYSHYTVTRPDPSPPPQARHRGVRDYAVCRSLAPPSDLRHKYSAPHLINTAASTTATGHQGLFIKCGLVETIFYVHKN